MFCGYSWRYSKPADPEARSQTQIEVQSSETEIKTHFPNTCISEGDSQSPRSSSPPPRTSPISSSPTAPRPCNQHSASRSPRKPSPRARCTWSTVPRHWWAPSSSSPARRVLQGRVCRLPRSADSGRDSGAWFSRLWRSVWRRSARLRPIWGSLGAASGCARRYMRLCNLLRQGGWGRIGALARPYSSSLWMLWSISWFGYRPVEVYPVQDACSRLLARSEKYVYLSRSPDNTDARHWSFYKRLEETSSMIISSIVRFFTLTSVVQCIAPSPALDVISSDDKWHFVISTPSDLCFHTMPLNQQYVARETVFIITCKHLRLRN